MEEVDNKRHPGNPAVTGDILMKLTITNQRGGVAKTTTTLTFAALLADAGQRVLVVDTDPQGSIHSILGVKPQHDLYDFIISRLIFEDCLLHIRPNLHLLPSTRRTMEAELLIGAQTAKEFIFANLFSQVDKDYDVVLVDVAPSINMLQVCAMVYTQHILVPVAMDTLSIQGAVASLFAVNELPQLLRMSEGSIRCVGLLPVMVNRRLAITQTVIAALEKMSSRDGVRVLPAIRQDQAVIKAERDRKFLSDYDPKAKALEDYQSALRELLSAFGRSDVLISSPEAAASA
jgi:chromosome partitioning protein